MICVQSFIDFICTTVYSGETDVVENRNHQMWRSIEANYESPYADGRWRWMIYDTDGALGDFRIDYFNLGTIDDPDRSIMTGPLFSNLLSNDLFRELFVLSFMDMANYTFHPDRVNVIIDEIYEPYSRAAEADFVRWGTDSISRIDWARTFFENRFDYAVEHLAANMELTGKLVTVTITVSDPLTGDITLNTITPELSDSFWSGQYFTDYPVTVTANPKPGYRFVRWETGNTGIIGSVTDSTIQVRLSGDFSIEAVFEAY